MDVAVEETTYEGERAVRLRAGTLSFTVLPQLGLTGVSLRHADGEFLALPGGLDVLREGRTTGFPFVGPWVNRLAQPRYRVGDVEVDVTEAIDAGRVRTDGNGLPIHGFLSGRSQWTVDEQHVGDGFASLRASLDVDDPAFPFPHRVTVDLLAFPDQLAVHTTITPTGDRAVPLAYGWHPYLVVPGTPRERWRLRTPAWQHLLLDPLGIPTGAREAEAAADEPVDGRTFDDLYAFAEHSPDGGLPPEREMALVGADGRSVTIRCRDGYDVAQVWVPEGKEYASLEPMAAPTNALSAGSCPVAEAGRSVTAVFVAAFVPPQ